jgi:hypothetical protein
VAHRDAPIGIRGHDAAAEVLANEWRDAELHPIAAVGAGQPQGRHAGLTMMAARNRGSLYVTPDSAQQGEVRRSRECHDDPDDGGSKH